MTDAELIRALATTFRAHRSDILARWKATAEEEWNEAELHVPPEFYARWVFVLFRLAIRHLSHPESRRLESFVRQSIEYDVFGRISIHDILKGISGLITLKWFTIEFLSQKDRRAADCMQQVCKLIETVTVRTRNLIITLYVERKENELRQRERYLDSIISSSADAIITIDDDKIIRSWNRGAQAVYGYTADEVIGKPVLLIFPPELVKQRELDMILEKLHRQGVIQEYETVRQAKDGRRINVELTATRLMDDQGKPTGIIASIVRDITERKELSQRLERKIQSLSIVNEIGRALQRTTDLNEILYTVLVGVTAGEALKFNRAFLFLLNPEQTRIEGRLAIGPSSPEEADRIWTDLASKKLSLNDILRSYRSGTALQDTRVNEMARQVNIPLTDKSHILIRTLTSRLSFNISEAQNHTEEAQDFLALIESRACTIVPLFSQDRPLGALVVDNFITRRPILDEDVETLEIFAQQASAAIENSLLYQTLAQQIRALEEANSDLKAYQEKLIHAERLSGVGEMAATMAHEIRNPLVAIGGFARRLQREMPPVFSQWDLLDIIIKEVMRLEHIVTEVLNLARPIPAPNEPHDINRILQESLRIVSQGARQNRIQVEERFQPDLPSVPINADQIKQVFLNILKNAIDATPHQGRITIWTSLPGTAYIEIGISDTGSGIGAEDLDRIFEPFFTTKPGGSGLGLTVASRIIRDHGGTLDVVSTLKEGTTFTIRLPVHQMVDSASAAFLNSPIS